MSVVQDHDVDWDSFVNHDLVEPHTWHLADDPWHLADDPWHYELTTLASSPTEYSDEHVTSSARSDDGLGIQLLGDSLSYEELGKFWLETSNDQNHNIQADQHQQNTISAGSQPPVVLEVEDELTGTGIVHHHSLPRHTIEAAIIPVTESGQTLLASSIPKPVPPVTTQESKSKHGRGGKRKRREKPPQSPHDIEKRYRSNLNDKIAELKVLVPTLRAKMEGVPEGEEFLLAGLKPARTLKKSVVLAKTIEYIKHLEDCNDALATQVTF
ncbi:hypothetical protein M409DRAFT_20397 [Zasmidium cellare ATCC 36951]|uniref:BHLH domain-containing protein n=1 Tax=Zasmidium cellare ATCC 36951 TaxID=1080233 RepID=A0A6A6CR55_ZASCE|nr:uncharacterized protein M409DRAFT_20397 [Zasmidium cellare ATCC 36951]KAF2169173.1 hypothetical protein M409DRAFT_20397 [Zasmidium cellare ATCC 36951]